MKLLVYAVLFIYVVSMVYPDTERYIFNNEVFSLLGFLVLTIGIFRRPYIKKSLLLVYGFVFYGLIVIAMSVEQMASAGLYLSFRTMTVWYSVFGFFLGRQCVSVLGVEWIARLRRKIRYVSWIGLFVTSFRLTPQVLVGASTGDKKYLLVLLLSLLFVAKGGSTTVTAIGVTLLFYALVNIRGVIRVLKKRVVLIPALALLGVLYFLSPLLNQFLLSGYDDFGSDNNLTWRLMLWIYLFNDAFIHHPVFGIGFGSPLFSLGYAPAFITSDDGSRFTEYTLGTHNSFFFVAMRTGLVGFVLVVSAHVQLYASAMSSLHRASGERRALLLAFLLSNLLFLNSALFNVVFESALYGANYWFSLGLLSVLAERIGKEARVRA